jgi:ribose/xylose/arabinose/galactoside ABC-type transport system permease subunit
MKSESSASPVRRIAGLDSASARARLRITVMVCVPLLLAAVGAATPGFFSMPSLYAVLTSMSYVGAVALGMTLITLSGNVMSFSLAATTTATTVVFVFAYNAFGPAMALALALAFGACVSGLQGLVIGWLRANPIIISIAALSLINGIFQAITGGMTVYPGAGDDLAALKRITFLGLPFEFVALLILLVVAQGLLSFTVFGRNILLVGDSLAAAEAAGIASWRTTAGAYLWAGLFAAISGIVLAVRFGEGNMVFAQGYDYGAIAAVLIGGTAIQGGRGSALRTLAGIVFISVVQVLLMLHGLSLQWQYFNLGIIVLGVIMLQSSSAVAPAPGRTLTGKRLADPHLRPLALFIATIVLLVAIDGGHGHILTGATAFSALQTFAAIGLVTLGLGITMIAGEFDLSVAGTFGMAGCIAVLAGEQSPMLGIALATCVGIIAGVGQALIIIRLRIGSTGVTLGGLLLFIGIAYVLTGGQSVPYTNMDVALQLNAQVAGFFSIRSLVTSGIFIAAAFFLGMTRIGRDLVAIGSDRRAAMMAGVNVPLLLVGAFAFSGAMAAFSGAMLSYSLASASPSGLADVLVPATAAAILGGVSLSGGMGRPLGIAAGVLTLATLGAGLNGLGATAAAQDIVTGSLLLAVAIADGGATPRRLRAAFAGTRRAGTAAE